MTIPKENWILLALRVKPLNARQLYLTLFYIWDELDRQIPEYFLFKASCYGPYPMEYIDHDHLVGIIYSSLYGLFKQNLILMPISFPKAGVCSLTDQGKATAESISPSIEADTLALVERVSCEISELKPSQLVRKWQSEVPEFANPPLASPEMCKKAMEILHSGKQNAFGEVEKLLGWGRDVSVPMDALACQLGITSSQLMYLHQRKYLGKREQEERTARKEVALMPGSVVTSQKLGFSIWLPDRWQVTSENNDIQDMSEGIEEEYAQWGKYSKKEKLKIAYQSFVRNATPPLVPGIPQVLPTGLKEEFAEEDADERIAEYDRRLQAVLRSKKKKGSQVGYWSASPREKGEEDPLLIEVIKFHFREPLSSLELYNSENPGHVSNVNRPATRKDLIIDGMQAVKAYYTWRDSWVGDKREPGDEQFATYLTEGLVGWTIDCWYTQSDRLMPRSLFHRIVSSFHRI